MFDTVGWVIWFVITAIWTYNTKLDDDKWPSIIKTFLICGLIVWAFGMLLGQIEFNDDCIDQYNYP